MMTSTDSSSHWKERTSTNWSPAVLPKLVAQPQLPQEPAQNQPLNKRKNNNLKNKHQRRKNNPSNKKKKIWVSEEDFSIDSIQTYHYFIYFLSFFIHLHLHLLQSMNLIFTFESSETLTIRTFNNRMKRFKTKIFFCFEFHFFKSRFHILSNEKDKIKCLID